MPRREGLTGHVRVSARTKDLPKARQRFEVSYPDPLTGRKRTKGGFVRRREAEDWLIAFNHSRREGTYVDDRHGAVLFKDAAGEWLDTQLRLKPRTRDSYERLLFGPRSALAKTFGNAPVGDIAREDVERWVQSQIRAQKAPTTIRNGFFLLQKVMKEQVVRRRITGNPCAAVQLPQVRKPRDEDDDDRHYLTPEEVDRLAEALPAPYDLLVRLAAYTGLRAGEIAGFQDRDIDLRAGLLHVRRSVIDVRGGLRYDTPKTAHSRRVVPLDDALVEELDTYLRAHRVSAADWFGRHPGAEHPGSRLPVFPGSARGGRTAGTVRLDYSKLHDHAQWYSTHWARAAKAAKLHPSVRFHDLRHTCASWLVQDGVGYKEVQEQLGHASVMITIDRYSHLDRGLSRDRVRAAMAERRAATRGSNVVRIRRSS